MTLFYNTGRGPFVTLAGGRILIAVWKEPVRKRPLAVTFIAWLLIAAGVLGFAGHLMEAISQTSFHFEDLWIPVISLLAAVSGVFMLLRHGWARWLGLGWMAFHVAISFFDSWRKVAVHVLLFALIAYILFNRETREYFR